ncbi:MAG: hypothetical protein J4478_05120 [Candidatus Diapherotrites archaeon]|uniref:Protein kinase domain-containing protein n=1 Tax=Candidatus Iainarchaeum sp. TaxID=3101447 RepID=A0A8T4KYP8_9ARCH|nr:hypothetical protein [Candidatus Diapherotrites archaeon]
MPEKPSKQKLLIPVKISTGKSGVALKRGTRAFVESSDWRIKEAEERERRYFLGRKKLHRFLGKEGSKPIIDFADWLDNRAEDLLTLRRKMARKSPFFVKPTSNRIKTIRAMLLKNGVPVEKPLDVRNLDAEDRQKNLLPTDLGNRLELFEREGKFPLPVNQTPEKQQSVRSQIVQAVTKTHSLGVSHNHLHYGNWVIGPSGKITLLDLSKAKLYLNPPRNKKEYLERFGRDIYFTGSLLTGLKIKWFDKFGGIQIGQPDWRKLSADLAEGIQEIISAASFPKSLKITPSDIISYYRRHY